MAAGRRVLVTGVAGDLGSRLASRLDADDRIASVVGVDRRDPAVDLGATEVVRADLTSASVARVLRERRIDTLVHLAITAEPGGAGGRSRMKESNVIRTMQLLGAAQSSPRLRRVVVKSTTAVYGSHPTDPALLSEDIAPSAADSSGYAKDAIEVESYARSFARRRQDVALTVLRFANFLGGGVGGLISRYLDLPVVPTVLGYDPRLQLCHGDDAVEVLVRSVVGTSPGIFNVAGPGVVYLSQLVRLSGLPQVAVPRPLVGPVVAMLRRTGSIDVSPEQLQFLLYGRIGDITRLRTVMGYEPRWSTRAAIAEHLAERTAVPLLAPERIERVERRLRRLLAVGR